MSPPQGQASAIIQISACTQVKTDGLRATELSLRLNHNVLQVISEAGISK